MQVFRGDQVSDFYRIPNNIFLNFLVRQFKIVQFLVLILIFNLFEVANFYFIFTVSKVPRNPNDPNWTFNYDQREVGVWEDSAGRPRVVGFVSGNIIPNDSDIKKFGIRTQMDHQHDVFFLVHALPNGKVLGVELAPGWNPPYLQKGDHNQLTS